MPIALGLMAALFIGSSDFLGARFAGRTTALQTTTAAFAGGAIAMGLVSPLLGEPSVRDLALGAASGVAAFVALTALWRGYAVSSIGIAAPVTAVVSTVLPVLSDTVQGDAPGALGWSGVVVGAAALVLTSWHRGRDDDAAALRNGVALGMLAGCAFAAMFVVAASTDEASASWPVVSQRATACVLAVAVGLGQRRRPWADARSVAWSLLAGALGAGGVAATVYGGQRGPLAPVVVAGSLYPAVAVALAWLLLRQRLTRRQVVGLVTALVGVVLIALD